MIDFDRTKTTLVIFGAVDFNRAPKARSNSTMRPYWENNWDGDSVVGAMDGIVDDEWDCAADDVDDDGADLNNFVNSLDTKAFEDENRMYRDKMTSDRGCGSESRTTNMASVSFSESWGIMGVIGSMLMWSWAVPEPYEHFRWSFLENEPSWIWLELGKNDLVESSSLGYGTPLNRIWLCLCLCLWLWLLILYGEIEFLSFDCFFFGRKKKMGHVSI